MLFIPYCVVHFELEASRSFGHNKLHSAYSSDRCCSGISSHFLQTEFIIFKGQHHAVWTFHAKVHFKTFCLPIKTNYLHAKNFHEPPDGLMVLNYRWVNLHAEITQPLDVTLSNGIVGPWHGFVSIFLFRRYICYLRDRKHFFCVLFGFLETWVKIWENEKCRQWDPSCWAAGKHL